MFICGVKMAVLRNIAFFTIMFFVGGCTQYWYQKDKTFNECKDDCIACRVESRAYLENYDKSDDFRIKYEEKCMHQKGYRLVSQDWLPLKTKKREPESLYMEKYGIAGCLFEEPVVEIESAKDSY